MWQFGMHLKSESDGDQKYLVSCQQEGVDW